MRFLDRSPYENLPLRTRRPLFNFIQSNHGTNAYGRTVSLVPVSKTAHIQQAIRGHRQSQQHQRQRKDPQQRQPRSLPTLTARCHPVRSRPSLQHRRPSTVGGALPTGVYSRCSHEAVWPAWLTCYRACSPAATRAAATLQGPPLMVPRHYHQRYRHCRCYRCYRSMGQPQVPAPTVMVTVAMQQ